MPEFHIALAETEEEKEAVYRFRYGIYVEEMGKYRAVADHERRMFYYLGLGQRTYSKKNVNSAEAGYLIPIVFVPEDVAYLRRIHSPLLEYVRDFGSDARVPACVTRILSGAAP